ncbi:MAG: hypothetical protein IJV67_03455 [Clostridia bacterium]|nr:hypothetical protein [Clostridia bacterium]
MAYLDKFHTLVGETVMQCQRIEYDVKVIYCAMQSGDMSENFKAVKNLALGQIITELETLDTSSATPCFSKSDYRLLKDIRNVRNWLAHSAYMDFMYESDERWSDSLNKSYERLSTFHRRMIALSNQVENVRFEIMRRFGRI